MPAETAWPLPVRVFPAAVGVLMLTSAAGKRPEWPGDIALAIGLGVLSTLAVVLGHLVMDRLGSNAYRRRTKLIQHATDPVVWGLNSVILLMLAVTYFNRALYGDGIPNLNARHVPGMGLLNIFDAMSAVFVVAIVLILFLFPWWPARSKLADEYRFMTLGMPAVAAAFVVIALASTLWLSGLPAVDAMFDAPTIWLEHWRMLFTSIFSRQTQPVAHWQAALAGLALLVVLHAHFVKKPLIGQALRPDLDENSRLASTRGLLFMSVALIPPVIGALEVVADPLQSTMEEFLETVLVSGFFIYGGHVTWTLGIEIASEEFERSPNRLLSKLVALWRIVAMIAWTFLYAGLLTVLWVTVFQWLIEAGTAPNFKKGFEVALNAALGVILIQFVFGHLYRRIWGYRLSDQWPGDRPNFIIFAAIMSLCVAAWPQSDAKPWLVFSVVLVCVVYPGLLLRRRLTAYTLIRVRPGDSETVQEHLEMSGMASAVVYGTQDLIAHVEVPQRGSREEALSELATRVNEKIRNITIEGQACVQETETLVDFSHLASFRHIASDTDSDLKKNERTVTSRAQDLNHEIRRRLPRKPRRLIASRLFLQVKAGHEELDGPLNRLQAACRDRLSHEATLLRYGLTFGPFDYLIEFHDHDLHDIAFIVLHARDLLRDHIDGTLTLLEQRYDTEEDMTMTVSTTGSHQDTPSEANQSSESPFVCLMLIKVKPGCDQDISTACASDTTICQWNVKCSDVLFGPYDCTIEFLAAGVRDMEAKVRAIRAALQSFILGTISMAKLEPGAPRAANPSLAPAARAGRG